MKKKNTVKFDRANRIITFEGKVIVDLRLIGTPSKARLYSKSGSDATGLSTDFSISETMLPFDFGFFSLGTAGFIAAAIENKLEIDGMLVLNGIEDAYRHVWMSDQRISRTKPAFKESERFAGDC